MILRALVLSCVVVVAGCRSAAPVQPTTAPVPPATRTATPDPDSIRWVRDAAEYQAAVLQAYRLATGHVEREARGRQAGSWVVVLDADETIISNLTYQVERARLGLGYTSDSWNQWVRRREATPLPGAAAFLSRTRALGGRVAVVTNRLESECADTAAVFQKYALVYDAMLCRPDGGPSDKNPRFQAVARGQSAAGTSPLDVVAFIGDNIQDFPGLSQAVKKEGEPAFAAFGERFFVIPNPMYGSWQ